MRWRRRLRPCWDAADVIRRIKGVLAGRTSESAEVLTPSGLSYEVRMSLRTIEQLPSDGEAAEFDTVLVTRDDGMDLYGFGSGAERELFLRLRSASGVGPRLALAILGALSGNRIIGAIRERDFRVLQTVSGVGKKTAERIVVELADKLDDLAAAAGEGAAAAAHSPAAAAVATLQALGYRGGEAERMVRQAAADRPDTAQPPTTEELVKAALAVA